MSQEATFKVPRLYKAAVKVARAVKEENGNLEQLVQEYNKKTNTKALAALVTRTLNSEDILDQIIRNSEILVKETNADPWLFRILISELLLGKQRLPVGSKHIQTVLAYGPTLRTELMRATGKLHNKRNRSKSETDGEEEDLDFKQESQTTHNQTSKLERDEETEPKLNPIMQSKHKKKVKHDNVKVEEDEDVKPKPKRSKNKQGKNGQGHVEEEEPDCKEESTLTYNRTSKLEKTKSMKPELNTVIQQNYIKLEKNGDVKPKSKKNKQSKNKLKKKIHYSEQSPKGEQVSCFSDKRRDNTGTKDPKFKKAMKPRYFE